MLARAARLPTSGDFAYEVKWDGFRAVVSTEGPTTGAESARRMGSCRIPTGGDRRRLLPRERVLPPRGTEQGVLAGAELISVHE